MFSRKFAAFIAVSIIGVAATACGSDDDNAATTTPEAPTTVAAPDATPADTSAADTTPASTSTAGTTAGTVPTGEPFVVGAVGGYSGFAAATLTPGRLGLEAWAKAVNASGGINGHPIDLRLKDDQSDPAKALAAVKELVEQDHIIALVGQASSFQVAFSDYLKEKGIPVIGGLDIGGGGPYGNDPNWFNVGTSYEIGQAAVVDIAKKQGGTRFGLVSCTEAPACEAGLKALKPLIENAGLELAFSQLVSASQPDFASTCLAAKDANIDTLYTALAGPTTVSLFTACAAQGLKVLQVGIAQAITQDFLNAPAFDGTLFQSPNVSFADTTLPAMQEFQAAMVEYSPDGTVDGVASAPTALESWASGKLFEAAVAAGNLGDGATSADVIDAMLALPKDETLGGIAPPLNFSAGKANINSCYFVMGIKDGAYTQPDGVQATCLPQS